MVYGIQNMDKNKYILACDERGTMYLNSSRNIRCFGGFIFPLIQENHLIKQWKLVKQALCNSENVELKWSHFFSGPHLRKGNPLPDEDEDFRKLLAVVALKKLFTECDYLSMINVVVKKKEAFEKYGELFYTLQDDGRYRLKKVVFYGGVLTSFIRYIYQTNGTGEIWMDQLGSRSEEEKVQEHWENIRENQGTKNKHPELYEAQLKIEPKIKFFDSSQSEIIQLADFVMGPISAAGDGDEFFFQKLHEYYTYDEVLRTSTYFLFPSSH